MEDHFLFDPTENFDLSEFDRDVVRRTKKRRIIILKDDQKEDNMKIDNTIDDSEIDFEISTDKQDEPEIEVSSEEPIITLTVIGQLGTRFVEMIRPDDQRILPTIPDDDDNRTTTMTRIKANTIQDARERIIRGPMEKLSDNSFMWRITKIQREHFRNTNTPLRLWTYESKEEYLKFLNIKQ